MFVQEQEKAKQIAAEKEGKAKLDELTVGATKTASGLMYFMENEEVITQKRLKQ